MQLGANVMDEHFAFVNGLIQFGLTLSAATNCCDKYKARSSIVSALSINRLFRPECLLCSSHNGIWAVLVTNEWIDLSWTQHAHCHALSRVKLPWFSNMCPITQYVSSKRWRHYTLWIHWYELEFEKLRRILPPPLTALSNWANYPRFICRTENSRWKIKMIELTPLVSFWALDTILNISLSESTIIKIAPRLN